MVGYAFGTRGYRIWKPETNEVAETKSVSFDETRCWGNIQRIHQQESEELCRQNDPMVVSEDDTDSDDESPITEPTVTAVHPVRGADPPRSPIQTRSRTALSGPVSHLVQKRLHKREYQQTRPGQIA
uniref:Retroviral polymerase SH3-like domain-containing protein n=1 Tax=Strigamia maritima TaxID=126957 RepID=T1IUE6_STRMM